jgi:ElaB/YqjD/DUF883 family membrane-anchored ribosome-binding protein
MVDQGVPKTSDGKPDLDALRAEIRNTRAELGETVEALAAKADVKARLKESAEQTKARVKEQAALTAERVKEQAAHTAELVKESARRRPVPWLAIAGGAAAAIVVLLVIRRRMRMR